MAGSSTGRLRAGSKHCPLSRAQWRSPGRLQCWPFIAARPQHHPVSSLYREQWWQRPAVHGGGTVAALLSMVLELSGSARTPMGANLRAGQKTRPQPRGGAWRSCYVAAAAASGNLFTASFWGEGKLQCKGRAGLAFCPFQQQMPLAFRRPSQGRVFLPTQPCMFPASLLHLISDDAACP